MSASATAWLTDAFLIVLGQQQIYQATIHTILVRGINRDFS